MYFGINVAGVEPCFQPLHQLDRIVRFLIDHQSFEKLRVKRRGTGVLDSTRKLGRRLRMLC